VKGNRIYFPIDKENVNARRLISESEAWNFLDEIQDIQELKVDNEKLREERYKEALNSGDRRQWVGILKTLYRRKQTRLRQGKKAASVDERYMKMAEEALYSELAFAMGKRKEEMLPLIREHLGKTKP
ncbi:MAG TPA: CarD family transcriptional regulator, partial [Candidatus Choladocola avistercoris]|nr:CarD family transcriptional regulator [Candidatus Choladocola avistercoris]